MLSLRVIKAPGIGVGMQRHSRKVRCPGSLLFHIFWLTAGWSSPDQQSEKQLLALDCSDKLSRKGKLTVLWGMGSQFLPGLVTTGAWSYHFRSC